jgi:hypothetical protein
MNTGVSGAAKEALGPDYEWSEETYSSLTHDAMRDMPEDWSPSMRMETDCGNDLHICSWDVECDGRSVKLELGFAITSERKVGRSQQSLNDELAICQKALRQSIWQMAELIRLSCYRLKEKPLAERGFVI